MFHFMATHQDTIKNESVCVDIYIYIIEYFLTQINFKRQFPSLRLCFIIHFCLK